MRTALKGIALSGAVSFGFVLTLAAYGQEADDSAELADTLESGEADAFTAVGQALGNAMNDTEKSEKNEFEKDQALLEQALSAPTPPTTHGARATPTLNDSLSEIERDVDSLKAQSKELSK